MTKRYLVYLSAVAEVEVEADNKEEAKEKALNSASSLEWHDADAYQIETSD